MKYVGQTSSSFKVRYQEHIRAIESNKSNPGYAQHILCTGPTYGNIDDTLKILHTIKKESYMHTLGKFHIYTMKTGVQMNKTNTDTLNPISEMLITTNNI
jgi:hypothetical protein